MHKLAQRLRVCRLAAGVLGVAAGLGADPMAGDHTLGAWPLERPRHCCSGLVARRGWVVMGAVMRRRRGRGLVLVLVLRQC